MSEHCKQIDSKLIHAGEYRPRILGAIAMPVFQSATYEYSGETESEVLRYSRLSNTPNHIVLNRKLAALENAEDALVTCSGMAAISSALLSILKAGDHLLAQDCLYGGTYDFITHDLAALGIRHDFIVADDPHAWEGKLRPETKAIYVEALTNPLLQVANLKAVPEFAREHNLVSLIDNTFASPINFRPSEWGFDLSLHSATKYLNGHSDVVAGAAIGRAHLIELIGHKLKLLGAALDPHAAFLLHRGIKTLALRMRRHNESALAIAGFLEQHPSVARVHYPGLESHPRHKRAGELFNGASGVVSFELKGGHGAALRFMGSTTIPAVAPSLGSVETLMTRPATTSHAGVPREVRDRLGISEGLIRLSVVIESTQDLLEDFAQALGHVE